MEFWPKVEQIPSEFAQENVLLVSANRQKSTFVCPATGGKWLYT